MENSEGKNREKRTKRMEDWERRLLRCKEGVNTLHKKNKRKSKMKNRWYDYQKKRKERIEFDGETLKGWEERLDEVLIKKKIKELQQKINIKRQNLKYKFLEN